LASLDDPYIVGYKEAFFEDEGSLLCIIMEYAGAGDIQRQVTEHIKSGKCIDESEIWKALIHITLGLRSLHRIGILHRDLKCANIFRSRNGTYKLGDLNVSKVSNEGLAKTQTGTPCNALSRVS
jgi:NIMA (never in mitosis gene a)-related kinase